MRCGRRLQREAAGRGNGGEKEAGRREGYVPEKAKRTKALVKSKRRRCERKQVQNHSLTDGANVMAVLRSAHATEVNLQESRSKKARKNSQMDAVSVPCIVGRSDEVSVAFAGLKEAKLAWLKLAWLMRFERRSRY